jgi:D-tyrosyl-tRNA(Tyr) deacylase
MKALIQRVRQASVSVEQQTVGQINKGLLVFLGVEQDDDYVTADKLLHKILHYRVFPDAQGKMNVGLTDAGGELLIVSQFTIVADTHKGLRPSFSAGAASALGEYLYQYVVAEAQKRCDNVATGRFGADMQVSLVNDGPVTFMLEVRRS